MKKQKAINIIQNQINKLDNDKFYAESWLIETRHYLNSFFGENSQQERYFKDFTFGIMYPGDVSKKEKIDRSKIFLKDCINTIQNVGLKKEPSSNFLSKIPSWLLTLILTGLFALAIMLGQILSDRQNLELKQENKELKEILSYKSTDSIANKIKDKGNQKK